jgi:hypothetical protein
LAAQRKEQQVHQLRWTPRRRLSAFRAHEVPSDYGYESFEEAAMAVFDAAMEHDLTSVES